jgi:predicted ATPase
VALAAPRGLYMHGGVGCGKTMLMDVLAAAAPPHFKVGVCLCGRVWCRWVGGHGDAHGCARGSGTYTHDFAIEVHSLPFVSPCALLSTPTPTHPPQLHRTYFHDFMISVHGALRRHAHVSDPLSLVADDVANEHRVRGGLRPFRCAACGLRSGVPSKALSLVLP